MGKLNNLNKFLINLSLYYGIEVINCKNKENLTSPTQFFFIFAGFICFCLFTAVSSGISLALASIFSVLLFSSMQIYKPWLASTQFNTILGGFLGSWLFLLSLTVRFFIFFWLSFFCLINLYYRLFQIWNQFFWDEDFMLNYFQKLSYV